MTNVHPGGSISSEPSLARRVCREHKILKGRCAMRHTNHEQFDEQPFFHMSKRRRGFPSETQVKRGVRIVHGGKLLEEKLGRNDLCPCGSGQRFKKCCLKKGCF